jgi:hypothetical protein
MKVIFISGPYRAKTWGKRNNNINHAREAAIKLWKQGHAVICPHMNTAHFDGACPDQVWLDGDLEILKRCDAIYVLKGYELSEGSKQEIYWAKAWNKEIIYE